MILTTLLSLLGAYVLSFVIQSYISVYYSPLSKYPGPKVGATWSLWKLWVEVVRQKSWTDELAEYQNTYGDVVRVGPNELHFSSPTAFDDIYNARNRWNKEPGLYRSFGEDESSFGFLSYAEAKERKAILQPLFSRQAVIGLQDLVKEKMDELCKVLEGYSSRNEPASMFFGAQCFTMDVITSYCFNRSVEAIKAPFFRAPIIEAMEASLPAFIVFKHFPLLRKFVFSLPPNLSKRISPDIAGLVDLQQILGTQVNEVSTNPNLLKESPHPIIYHALLNPKNECVPSPKSLYEEAQVLMFGGGDTSGNVLFLGTLHVLESQEWTQKLKTEVQCAWPVLEKMPSYEDLEKLPFLTAVIKESLRVSPGVSSPLLRVTPSTGASVAGNAVPGNTIVGMSSIFVHNNEQLFKDPDAFIPDRWLGSDPAPQEWLVPFSKGPRSCLGSNLAWCELYIAFASLFRRFDMELKNVRTLGLKWRDCFLPKYNADELNVLFKTVNE